MVEARFLQQRHWPYHWQRKHTRCWLYIVVKVDEYCFPESRLDKAVGMAVIFQPRFMSMATCDNTFGNDFCLKVRDTARF